MRLPLKLHVDCSPVRAPGGFAHRKLYMNTRIKRPPTVWLTQIFLILLALIFLLKFLNSLLGLLINPPERFYMVPSVIDYLITPGTVLLLLIAFYGLVKRKVYGKRLSLLLLLLIWSVVILIDLLRPIGQNKYYEHKDSVELGAEVLFHVLVHVFFLTIILRLSFAKKVSEFFRKETELR